jgi:hypothetical protein
MVKESEQSGSGSVIIPEAEKKEAKKQSSRARSIAVGREYEFQIEMFETQTRGRIVWASYGAIGAALSVAAAYSIYTKDFSSFEHVWSAAAPFVGGIFTYYFTRSGSRKR